MLDLYTSIEIFLLFFSPLSYLFEIFLRCEILGRDTSSQ